MNWECLKGKDRKKSIFLFGTNTQWESGRWKSDSCSNKINGRLMIYQHQNQQTEEAFKCLTLTHNIFSGVKYNNNNNNNSIGRIEIEKKQQQPNNNISKRTKYVDIFLSIETNEKSQSSQIPLVDRFTIAFFVFVFSCPHIVENCLFLVAPSTRTVIWWQETINECSLIRSFTLSVCVSSFPIEKSIERQKRAKE